ncbi:MAG: ABC transporter permease subunit [Christensenellales bacterium]|jgi:simple sugar transport system permease protein
MRDKIVDVINHFGSARLIITMFFLILVIFTFVLDLSPMTAMSDVLVRWAMNYLLVLAMIPGILSGVGLNFASPLGITCGLLGSVLSIEFGFTGALSLIIAILISIPISLVIGYLYGIVLNVIKGSEMMIATYVGFAFVSVMSIVWLFLPVKNESLTMAMGNGLRTSIDLTRTFRGLLNNLFIINVGNLKIPFGFIMVCGGITLLLMLFLNSRSGIIMCAAGENPIFSSNIGINVNKQRILGIVLSTALSAVGIIFYAQSYGFLQMYQAPLMMAFPAVAAILIGGATTRTASIGNAILGSLLYNGILTLSMPVANALAPQSNLSEIVRIVASNGIIVYALTKIKREG